MAGFSGRTRRRTTQRSVLLADRTARGLITVGGVATIAIVLGVCLFLFWVALPLFRPARVEGPMDLAAAAQAAAAAAPAAEAGPRHVAVDEHQQLGWAVFGDGRLEVFGLGDGRRLARRALFPPDSVTAACFPGQSGLAAFGFRDGSLRLVRFGVATRLVDGAEVPAPSRPAAPGGDAPWGEGVVRRMAEGAWRWQQVSVEIGPPLPLPGAAAVRRLGLAVTPAGPLLCALTADGRLHLEALRERRNLLTGTTTYQPLSSALPYAPVAGDEPAHILVSSFGDNVYVAWEDGRLLRFDTRELARPVLAENLDLTRDGARLTALSLLTGGSTLVAGDDRGRLRAWFRVKPETAYTSDGALLVNAHTLPAQGSAVTALGFSSRNRIVISGHADGTLLVHHLTAGRQLARTALAGGPVLAAALAPKDDGFLAVGPGAAGLWRLDARHPEATFAALFKPVWYEGYPRPAHVWQSSAATDESELKYGLLPLVFGTLKATFYSLLFGVPLALLAAVYTSEFLRPRVKANVKPAIELMASLPSVVLGFLAALVIAPFAERVVPAVLAGLLAVPAVLLLGAAAWQLLPRRLGLRLADRRLEIVLLCLPLGVAAGAALGRPAERVLFGGDLKLWLDGQSGGPAGGWFVLLLPAAALAVALLGGRATETWRRRRYAAWSRARSAGTELALLAAAGLAATGLAAALAGLLSLAGLDPRGAVLGTYVQRNSLVVGFVMGFAIIPIIYTIAEDALASVPEHLRAASLGAGATPWQTAVRIIVPTAMSGLFSAVMIGLGRAVGETMIVLMAAGNTPILEWNPFNGFRTLSANIAVEMPEAVRDSTHYRILFLSALVLFGITFLLNTAAEIVRQRFRKRAFEL